MQYIKWFDQLGMDDVPIVGGKNAALGQMITQLSDKGIAVPRGFATTADAYWYYLSYNKLRERMISLMEELTDSDDLAVLQRVGNEIRTLIAHASMPDDLATEIITAYKDLSAFYDQDACDVAVRSSATAEDLPTASFAGQQETFLNIKGADHLIIACKKAFASLFTDRAIIYRREKGFEHFQVALSIGVQKMVRSDLASSGVAFSLDTETGFPGVIMIDSSWGLGEAIVQGLVNPDQFFVFKETLKLGYDPILQKRLGEKKLKMVYGADAQHPVEKVAVPKDQERIFSLTNAEVASLASMVLTIEEHYSQKNKRWSPMDVEWAKDGQDGKLYILQARPETVHGIRTAEHAFVRYTIDQKKPLKVLTTGLSIGQQIATGSVRIVPSAAQISQVQKGDILVTEMTDPDWVPAMKKAAGIITVRGGRTCHAAIVSRELGTPALVGAYDALEKLRDGQKVTIDCSQGAVGFVYDGAIEFEKKEIRLDQLRKLPVDVMISLANPETAFSYAWLPVTGVGLARLEFIISHAIGIHPMALVDFDKVKDEQTRREIERRTVLYSDKKMFYIDQLAQGIAMIAAAFYPKPVFARLSDFKTNEYRNLLGGTYFEPIEENPMLGFRGASRYIDKRYQAAFALECAAFKKVRDEMGLTNVQVMVPFVRTVKEAQEVIEVLRKHGLERSKDLQFIMMCEIPSNVLLIDEFSRYFDGFSIGSNDLTQLVLGVDRDSGILSELFDERNPAVKKMLHWAIEGARRNKKYSSICGQAPSDYPEIAKQLIDWGIDSISLNPDAVIPFFL